jgi:two-component system response regulator VicR
MVVYPNLQATQTLTGYPVYTMYHILVIDDEKPILDMVRLALTRVGFEVEIASDGLEGIQKFEDGHFDLVITDILMPGINGKDVVRHIRNSNKPDTPIIGFSGTPWLLENIEFDTVFTKPFSLKDLVNSIRDLSSKAVAI